jgi:hypothetical protein
MPQYHFKKSSFAVPVSADKADTFTRIEDETCLLKNDLLAITFI